MCLSHQNLRPVGVEFPCVIQLWILRLGFRFPYRCPFVFFEGNFDREILCRTTLMLSVEAVRHITNTLPFIGVFLSVLKKGRDFSTPFDKNQLSAANFPLRLCFSPTIMVLGIPVMSPWVHAKTYALDLKRSCSFSLKFADTKDPLNFFRRYFLELFYPFSYFVRFVRQKHDANSSRSVEFDGFVDRRDYDAHFLHSCSSEQGQECSPEKPTSGVFESTRRDLAFMITGLEELLSLKTGGNMISLHLEIGSSNYFPLVVVEYFLLIMRMGASAGTTSLSPFFHSPRWVSEAFAFPFLFPLRGGKVVPISLLPQSGVLIHKNRWCRAHDLHGNGSTWSCHVTSSFRAYEGVVQRSLRLYL
ncbi:hypothetical protein Tco_0224002 [Tanacetum coccineum]